MCGRFAQYSSRDEYFETIGLKPDEIIYDPEPIGRYNVAPGTKVLLSDREEQLRLDPVFWGYGPEWWDKQPLIDAHGENSGQRVDVQASVAPRTCRHARKRLV